MRGRIRGGDGGFLRVVNLCSHGVCLEVDPARAIGDALRLDLRHPHLPPLKVPAVVRWCQPGSGQHALAGLEFMTVSAENRRAIRRLLAAEAGSCVLPAEGGAPAGFVAANGNVWSFYDQDASRVAVLTGESPQYKLTLGRAGPRGTIKELPVGSFADAIRAAFELWEFAVDPPRAPEGEPLPPAPARRASAALAKAPASRSAQRVPAAPPPAAQPSPKRPAVARAPREIRKPCKLQGSAVMRGDVALGYVARTSEGEWALFDPDQEQIGVLTQRGATFTVFWLGESVDDSYESLEAGNFAMAVAKAFELEGFPHLVSAVIEPRSLITKPTPDAAKHSETPGSRVLHKRRLVGYVCPSDMPGVWMVINRKDEQVAIVNRQRGQFQVCLMGQSPDESMEFENHDDIADAVAFALELRGRPLIEPQIDV